MAQSFGRLVFKGTAAGALWISTLLPHVSVAWAANPIRLVATATASSITAVVQGATGTPVYQFRLGNQILARYSSHNVFALSNLSAGTYTITVRSLGQGQFRQHQWTKYRSTTVRVTVQPSDDLVVTGPANATATNGSATIHASITHSVGTPYFQFTLNGSAAQSWSVNSAVHLNRLAAGIYTIEVASLGPAQYSKHEWSLAKHQALTITVPQSVNLPTSVSMSVSPADLSPGGSAATLLTTAETPTVAYVEAFGKNNLPTSLTTNGVASVSYQLSADNGTTLTAINGVGLSSPAQTVSAVVYANGTVVANNQSMGTVDPGTALLPFSVEATDLGQSAVTVTANGQTATLNLQVAAVAPASALASPTSIVPATGLNQGSVTETITVEGSDGSVAPYATVTLDGSTPGAAPGGYQSGGENDAVWVSAVNGTELTRTVGSTVVPDAFPLVDGATNLSNLGYQYPTANSQVSFQDGSMTATANVDGQITLTINGGGVSFWATANGLPASLTNPPVTESSQNLSAGTYGLGIWYQNTLLGSATVGNGTIAHTGIAPTALSLAVGSVAPLVFTFKDGAGHPIIGAGVNLSSAGLTNASFGVSSVLSNDTQPLSKLTDLVTNAQGQVTVYVTDDTAGNQGTVTASVDGIDLTSGTVTVRASG
ncbi:MAG: hypothetical protein M1600_03550 [Firmicutes bacterium]|nr:hypothetical protein [Bacillota bacterium]